MLRFWGVCSALQSKVMWGTFSIIIYKSYQLGLGESCVNMIMIYKFDHHDLLSLSLYESLSALHLVWFLLLYLWYFAFYNFKLNYRLNSTDPLWLQLMSQLTCKFVAPIYNNSVTISN